jgi:hypothetical protein
MSLPRGTDPVHASTRFWAACIASHEGSDGIGRKHPLCSLRFVKVRALAASEVGIDPSIDDMGHRRQDVDHRHSDDAGDGKDLRPAVFCVADARHVRWNEIAANDDQAALKFLRQR